MPDAVQLREVAGPDDALFRGAWALLRRTFPASELVPRSELRYALRERAAGVWTDLQWHLVVACRGDRVVGVASGTYVGSLNVGLIGYLAVDRRHRVGGLGLRLRRWLVALFRTDARRLVRRSLGAVVGEVEADNPWLRHLIRTHGALALDVDYVQPEVRPAKGAVPLVLYWEPVGGRRIRHLGSDAVRKLLYMIWRRGYRIARPLEDARFRRMLRGLEGRQVVGARRLPPARRADGKKESGGLRVVPRLSSYLRVGSSAGVLHRYRVCPAQSL